MAKDKKIIAIIIIILVMITSLYFILKKDSEKEIPMNNEEVIKKENKLYYLGHASLRITTSEGKVIYIDPYMSNDYDIPADLVLITHGHYDHNDISKIKNRNTDFKVITWKEALVNGTYQVFDLDYAKIEAVEAGYNQYHNKNECVGYVITLSDDTKIYIAGDTSETPTMGKMNTWNIDYAFYPCDGTYTMTTEEATIASEKVNARYSIPYHVVSDGRPFDLAVANKFNAKNKLIIKPQEEITLIHE